MMGRQIADRYQILNMLGCGNIANTYLAHDLCAERPVRCVVKHLIQGDRSPKRLAANQRLFAQEAQSLKILGTHSQIPQLLDHFKDQNEWYLVQEFIEGHPLTAELPVGERWPVLLVMQFLTKMLELLRLVHSQGVIHRDIKPSNIMRRQSDHRLVLIDFGGVQQVAHGHSTVAGTSADIVVGTLGYMPVEQADGRPQPNSDVYALGMIAIQALTGLLPRHLPVNDRGERLWRDYAAIEDDLATVLAAMVHPNHQYRFQSATEALEALQSLQQPTSLRGILPDAAPPLPPNSTLTTQSTEVILRDPSTLSS